MKVAIITSGGDSPGMNWFVYSLKKILSSNKIETVLIQDGFKGIQNMKVVDKKIAKEIINYTNDGGTIIGASRLPELEQKEVQIELGNKLKAEKITHLVVLGGNGSFKGAYALSKQGLEVYGVPGTIDNDVGASDMSLGFYSALQVNVDAIEQTVKCARSHSRFFIFETMGGYASQLAIDSAMLTHADFAITHEKEWTFEDVVKNIKKTMKKKKYGFMVMPDLLINDLESFRTKLEKESGYEIRMEVLGRLQRSATPNVYDKLFGIKLANKVCELILNKESNKVVILKNGKVVGLDIKQAIKPIKKHRALDELEIFEEIK